MEIKKFLWCNWVQFIVLCIIFVLAHSQSFSNTNKTKMKLKLRDISNI